MLKNFPAFNHLTSNTESVFLFISTSPEQLWQRQRFSFRDILVFANHSSGDFTKHRCFATSSDISKNYLFLPLLLHKHLRHFVFGGRMSQRRSGDQSTGNRRWARTDADGYGRTQTDTDGRRRIQIDGRRQTQTDTNRHEQTRTDTSGHGRTHTDTDGRGRM